LFIIFSTIFLVLQFFYDEIVEVIENPEEIIPSIKERLNYCRTMGGRHIIGGGVQSNEKRVQ